MKKTVDRLALYVAAKHQAERERNEAQQHAKALELQLELERQRSAALAFELAVYKERMGDII